MLARSSRRLHDLTLLLFHQTSPGDSEAGAILVSQTDEEDDAVWLPKSLIEFDRPDYDSKVDDPEWVTVVVPHWLARDKGLV
jgi:hypothetical protein